MPHDISSDIIIRQRPAAVKRPFTCGGIRRRPRAIGNRAGKSRPCFLRIISSDVATLDAFILGNQVAAVPTSNCYRMYVEAYKQIVRREPYFAYLPDIHTYLARNACVYTFVLASCSLNDFFKLTALLWSKSLTFYRFR